MYIYILYTSNGCTIIHLHLGMYNLIQTGNEFSFHLGGRCICRLHRELPAADATTYDAAVAQRTAVITWLPPILIFEMVAYSSDQV